MSKCANAEDIKKGREWVRVDDPQGGFTIVVAGLGRECREWPKGATDAAH